MAKKPSKKMFHFLGTTEDVPGHRSVCTVFDCETLIDAVDQMAKHGYIGDPTFVLGVILEKGKIIKNNEKILIIQLP